MDNIQVLLSGVVLSGIVFFIKSLLKKTKNKMNEGFVIINEDTTPSSKAIKNICDANKFCKAQGKITSGQLKELVEEAKSNLNSTLQFFPNLKNRVHWTDLESYKLPEETSCIFLFNPFNEKLIGLLVSKIKGSDFRFPLYILYASPVHLDVFEKTGFRMIKEIELLSPLKGVVLYWPDHRKNLSID